MKTDNDFFLNLIHDIKSPLLGVNFAIKSRNKDEFLKDIYKTNSNTLNIINNSLLLFNNKKINFNSIDFLKILNNVIYDYKFLLENKSIKIVKLADSYQIFSNETCVIRILSNLISNAIKYSVDNSQILITLKNINNDFLFEITNEIKKERTGELSFKRGLNIVKQLSCKINAEFSSKKRLSSITFRVKFNS